jgi:hypothetical protein
MSGCFYILFLILAMLSKRIWIEEKDLFDKVDEASIFERYFGPFQVRSGCYHSPFREDEKPSTGFYINTRGKIVYHDFTTKEKLDCVQFVMKMYSLEYKQALLKIATDFALINGAGIIADAPRVISKSVSKTKREKTYQVGYTDFDEQGMAYWNQYHITPQELDENSVFQVSTLYVDGVPFPSDPEKPRFCYLIKGKDKDYLKVYSPFDEKKYKWLSSTPIFLPFGIYELPFKSDTLIVAKSQKDRIVLKKFFTDVISLQNESQEALLERTAKYLKSKYKRIIFWFDNDVPGMRALEEYKNQRYTTHHFPTFYLADHGVKDPADFVKKWSVRDLEVYIKQNNLC